MSDGTRIAVHVFLPEGLAPGTPLPTVMSITPYFSVTKYRSALAERLARKLSMSGGLEMAETLPLYGFATVLMDMRGSAVSFGQRKSVMMPDVVRDTHEVIDWIVAQPWSNGRVGATGVSAVGMTAQWVSTSKHPALKAIAPRFTVFDVFGATHCGGLTPATFMKDIGRMLRHMDANELPQMPEQAAARLALRFLVRGLQPVDDDPDGRVLAQASAEHAGNTHLDMDLVAVSHRDDRMPSTPDATIDAESPFMFAADMAASEAAVYGWAGWGDGAFVREMFSLHNTVRTPGSRMVIGPWPHGGRWYASPLVDKKTPTAFDHFGELARFFDFHLRDLDHAYADDAPIHYYTTGEERWKTTPVWPPTGVETQRLWFGEGHRLTPERGASGHDQHTFDMTHTSGPDSRFGRHLAGGRYPVTYPDRASRDKTLLTYDAAPLDRDLEVTGSPIVSLFATFSTDDAAVFVYLEDVAPDGTVRHVTDGMLRASRRAITPGDAPYWLPGPWRALSTDEVRPVAPGEVAELTFDLYPTSHRFATGHALRIAIAGADTDTIMAISTGPAPEIGLQRGADGSFIDLPVNRG